MLGRKNFTQQEYDHAKASIDEQLATYKTLKKAISSKGADKKTGASLESFEATFFNNMVLVLDRPFVHRLRGVTGKDGNALNEVELLVDSLINNNGIFEGINAINYIPEESVLRLNVGDRIRLTEPEFESLAAAFFAELKAKYLYWA